MQTIPLDELLKDAAYKLTSTGSGMSGKPQKLSVLEVVLKLICIEVYNHFAIYARKLLQPLNIQYEKRKGNHTVFPMIVHMKNILSYLS